MWPFGKKQKNITVNVNIDYEKLAKEIVAAQEESTRENELRQEQKRQEILAKRKEILHEKDFSCIKCWPWRAVRTLLNRLRVFFGIIFVSKKNAQYFAGVAPLAKLLALSLLALIRYGFYTLSIVCVYGIWKQWGSGHEIAWLAGAFVLFVIARVIRIAKFEIEAMKSETNLMTTAMAVVSVFALILSAIGIVSGL